MRRICGRFFFAARDAITKSGWGRAWYALRTLARREPLEPDPGHAGVGKPARTERSQFGRKPLPRVPGGRLSSMPDATITITLNGDPRTIDGDAGLVALIAQLKMRPQ